MGRVEHGKRCLEALVKAWSSDSSGFKLEVLLEQLSEISCVLDGEFSSDDFLENHGIDPDDYTWMVGW